MTTQHKHILLSAFECNPYQGSDAEVGWQWARQLSKRGFTVTVITRTTHKAEIEQYMAASAEPMPVNFQYVDIAWMYPITEKFNSRNHFYYYFWQIKAYLEAKKLHVKQHFDLVHHVTWASFRQPSFMGFLDIPMYFGPVAGGDEVPAGYGLSFGLRQKVEEQLRTILNYVVRFDPLMWIAYHKASRVFFTSSAHLKKVPPFVRSKVQIELAIGCDTPTELQSSRQDTHKQTSSKQITKTHNKLLYVGRCIGWKGMDIGLKVFAAILAKRPDVTLTIVGDGFDRSRWMKKAQLLGVDAAIEWRGWLPKAEVSTLYAQYDAFFFPSLRDSGGFVILEALQQGLPVVCFKLGGPGVIVDDSCGKAVIAQADLEMAIAEYANSAISVLNQSVGDADLANRCKQRAQFFDWDSLINRIYGDASQIGSQ